MRSKISSKLIFASCVWYFDRAHYELCVLIKDIGRRLPLQLQCSYQGQQGDVSQSVRGNYKTRFWGGQNLTGVEGNASVYRVNPISRISGEGRAEFLRTWGPDFDLYICNKYTQFVNCQPGAICYGPSHTYILACPDRLENNFTAGKSSMPSFKPLLFLIELLPLRQ